MVVPSALRSLLQHLVPFSKQVTFSFYLLPPTQNPSNTEAKAVKIQTDLSRRKFLILIKGLFLQEPYIFLFSTSKGGG